ncbi:Crp/Fnr family transcriptional regulator [Mesorhizobium sp. BH1-1-5]|uniref:Crp/Fnr family transcriptional regulator n=1 Tax=unclassified Mesorhizobium TaxID=325217 RepID=UPI0015E45A01|nr:MULTISPECIES: Crp/Fnr family transcriptional regulator [unclassified Mesorhizobium]MBZ9986796.1 Crp/Fnr family transcriptional regulator [Mesorhizobium sp. BH1-1-5]
MRRPLIRKLEKFTRLSQADKNMLAKIGGQRVRRFSAREDIIHEGEKPEYINLINEGWACRYKTLEDGRRQIIAFFLPGDLCDLNVFILKEMDHSIGAVTPVVISEISRTAFDEMMMGHPRITQALWWESLVAAAIQREWTVNLGQRDALERMAHLLCELFIRLEAAGCTSDSSCEFPLTQTELGDTLGMSTVHVNRTLQELRASNLIVLKDRTLTIPNLKALQSVALFNANYLHLDHEGTHLDANEE